VAVGVAVRAVVVVAVAVAVANAVRAAVVVSADWPRQRPRPLRPSTRHIPRLQSKALPSH